MDDQASQGAHQRPKGPPHHLYRHPANRPSLPAGGFNGDARVLWVIADSDNLAGKAATVQYYAVQPNRVSCCGLWRAVQRNARSCH